MRVEQWRLGSLSSENGADITFEEIKDDEDLFLRLRVHRANS